MDPQVAVNIEPHKKHSAFEVVTIALIVFGILVVAAVGLVVWQVMGIKEEVRAEAASITKYHSNVGAFSINFVGMPDKSIKEVVLNSGTLLDAHVFQKNLDNLTYQVTYMKYPEHINTADEKAIYGGMDDMARSLNGTIKNRAAGLYHGYHSYEYLIYVPVQDLYVKTRNIINGANTYALSVIFPKGTYIVENLKKSDEFFESFAIDNTDRILQ